MRADPEAADMVLLALVARVVDHDDALVARVLLRLLLPGTRNLARRWWALGDTDERAAPAGSPNRPMRSTGSDIGGLPLHAGKELVAAGGRGASAAQPPTATATYVGQGSPSARLAQP